MVVVDGVFLLRRESSSGAAVVVDWADKAGPVSVTPSTGPSESSASSTTADSTAVLAGIPTGAVWPDPAGTDRFTDPVEAVRSELREFDGSVDLPAGVSGPGYLILTVPDGSGSATGAVTLIPINPGLTPSPVNPCPRRSFC